MKKLLISCLCAFLVTSASISVLLAQKADAAASYAGTLDPKESWFEQSVCWNYRSPCPPEDLGGQGSQN